MAVDSVRRGRRRRAIAGNCRAVAHGHAPVPHRGVFFMWTAGNTAFEGTFEERLSKELRQVFSKAASRRHTVRRQIRLRSATLFRDCVQRPDSTRLGWRHLSRLPQQIAHRAPLASCSLFRKCFSEGRQPTRNQRAYAGPIRFGADAGRCPKGGLPCLQEKFWSPRAADQLQ